MGLSTWHLLILGLVAVLVFGGSGRISLIMGDVAKGIKSFKKGLSEDEDLVGEITDIQSSALGYAAAGTATQHERELPSSHAS